MEHRAQKGKVLLQSQALLQVKFVFCGTVILRMQALSPGPSFFFSHSSVREEMYFQ